MYDRKVSQVLVAEGDIHEIAIKTDDHYIIKLRAFVLDEKRIPRLQVSMRIIKIMCTMQQSVCGERPCKGR